MSTPAPTSSPTRTVFVLAAVLTVATVMMGSIVAATDSSAACPAWPQCYPDRIRPDVVVGWLENPAIEMFHRAVSGLCVVMLLIAGLRGRGHRDVRIRVFPWLALVGAVAAAVFGMMTVLWHLPTPLAMLDLGGALLAMVLIVVGAVATSPAPASPRPALPSRSAPRTVAPGTCEPSAAARRAGGFAGLAVVTALVMHMLGVVVAGSTQDGYRSFTRVMSWPVFRIVPIDGSPALQVARMVLAAITVALVVAAVVVAVRAGHRRGVAWGALAALAAELVLGGVIAVAGLADAQTNGIHPELAITYSVLATTLMVLLAMLTADRLAPRDRTDATTPPRRGEVTRADA